MPRYIAFLRAINVGGHTVKMDRLRTLFEETGARNVETFIASGNVIFESTKREESKLETQIERHLERALGYPVETFLRTPGQLADIAKVLPFGDETKYYVGFLKEEPAPAMCKTVRSLSNDVDQLDVRGREVFWLCRKSILESTFSGARLEKMLGMPATLRNVNTVNRLIAKYPAN